MSESSSLISLFEQRVNISGSAPALRSSVAGHWEQISWRAWWELSERLAAGLISLGVEPGDRVALLASTSAQWAILDVAILMAGAVVVPLYAASRAEQIQATVENAGATFACVEDPLQAQKLLAPLVDERLRGMVLIQNGAVERGASSVESIHIEDLDPDGSLARRDALLDLDTLAARGRRMLADSPETIVARRRAVRPDHLATLVYTSGTTGEPLGVRLSHAQMLAELDALATVELITPRDVHLMALPLAHIFARSVLWAGVKVGFETAFARELRFVMQDMREVSPTMFAGVPHIFERIQRQLAHRLADVESPLIRGGLEAVIAQGVEISRYRQRHRARVPGGLNGVMHRVLGKTLYPQMRALFGGKLRFFISGGAPLSVDVAEFFHACDLLILEGYGLTETCAAITMNTPGDFRFGSVGRPLPGVDVTISELGEILVRADMCTHGYKDNSKRTDMLIDDDGWLHTGDLGRFDRDGYLYINGRMKNLIVTSGGKNIAPLKTEQALERSSYISRAVLFGDRRHYLTALITLDRDAIERWAAQQNLERPEVPIMVDEDASTASSTMIDSGWGWLTTHERVRALIQTHVDEVNARLASFESVRKFAILDADFSLESGELTPTSKLRRATVESRHRALLDGLYGVNESQGEVSAR